MTGGEKTRAACLASVLAEPIFPVARPVDVMDADLFPELAELRRHAAAMTPERRAEIEGADNAH